MRNKKQDFLDQDWHQLQLHSANNKHLQIVDRKGRILAYRIPLPEKHLQQLVSTEHLIPSRTVKQHSRGITSNRHWGLWKKYVVDPRMTGDYLKDLPHSQQWLEENQGLFQHLSNILHLLDPKMYVRFSSIKKFLPEGVVPACGAWYACALNLSMTADGWGSFKSSKLVLWQLGVVLETLPGDAVFFMGRLITHNTVDIQGGIRNLINCFVHQAPLSWKDQKHKELTGFDRAMYSKKRKQHAGYPKYTETPSRKKQQRQHSIAQHSQQQEGARSDAECIETISRTKTILRTDGDGNGNGNGNGDGERAETMSRAETGSPNRAEPPHSDEQQDKGKKRQQDEGDAESAESAMDGGDLGTEDELEAMYELRLGDEEQEEEED
ncbi:MAG: hypothetical protein M1840_001980 [Geoglossum simile]|nr:MAG: hypothetical protein M1840_001980 [Geoglossum simile]